MPTISNALAYDVPKIARIPDTPCMVVPCAYCHGVHTFPADSTEIVKSQCPPHGPAFGKRPRPDFHVLMSGGPATRQLLLIYETSKDMSDDLDILAQFQPWELASEIQTLDYDPTTVPSPRAGEMEIVRQMSAEFDEGTMTLAPMFDKPPEVKHAPVDEDE